MYTNNNPLAYIRESKLGVAQIRWLSELALFDFDIKYRTGKSNKAADAWSHRPNDSEEMDSNPESEKFETISYAIECEELEGIIDGEKIPQECKVAIQNKEDKPASEELEIQSNVIQVLSKVSTIEMREAFDHLEFRKGVLHRIYEIQGSKYHQLVLPKVYRAQVLQLLHDEQGHQRTECTMDLIRERFF